MVINKFFQALILFIFGFAISASCAFAQQHARNIAPDPRFDKVEIKSLDQNWSDKESNWFYGVPQGSRLIPYDWFINLEQADNEEKFIAPEHMQKLGYIARVKSEDNPDALPIGFTKDLEFEDQSPALGVTCAACHTGQIIHDRVAYIVDGGPSMGDFSRLLKDLVSSMDNTIDDAAKFKRFSKGVLGDGAKPGDLKELKSKLTEFTEERRQYNLRNLPIDFFGVPFGYGRVDAFGAIFNEVSIKFIELEGNGGLANAPVSYPCLWDTPQHVRVQWNGAAENKKNDVLGPTLFGTNEVGALGRNAGEVLGVFGHTKVNRFRLPIRYKSTINKKNLIEIENSVKTLWSPKWPEAFGEIEEEKRKRGESIYLNRCVDCHQPIIRNSKDRKVDLRIALSGTDPTVLTNFARTVKTGKLEGRRISIFGDEVFKEEAMVGKLLKHMVERSILDLDLKKALETIKGIKLEDLESLKPDYSNMTILKVGDKDVPIPFEDLKSLEKLIKSSEDRDEAFKNALQGLKAKLMGDPSTKLPKGYKSRPLNGVWATAPYLHNGSVPTLAQLLTPPHKRDDKFHVGSQVFDPINVGFVNDPKYPEFDATQTGNLNDGHDHGTDLSAEDKLALIEYLKSL